MIESFSGRGHRIGSAGALIPVTPPHEMRQRNAGQVLAALCIGGGMGVAHCPER
nr:hypothetical protein [uncultured Rhodopila sp.]